MSLSRFLIHVHCVTLDVAYVLVRMGALTHARTHAETGISSLTLIRVGCLGSELFGNPPVSTLSSCTGIIGVYSHVRLYACTLEIQTWAVMFAQWALGQPSHLPGPPVSFVFFAHRRLHRRIPLLILLLMRTISLFLFYFKVMRWVR